MSSRIASVVIDAVQPRVVADFWCHVLGWHVLDEDDGVISIGPPDGAWPTIDVVPVPESKTVKNRLHLDLSPVDGDQDAEVARLEGLGARRTDLAPDGATWVVMRDPEDNEFCVLRSLAPGHFSL